MPRKALGPKPLSNAERQRAHRERIAERTELMRAALRAVIVAKTKREASKIAAVTLELVGGENP